jgi:hypothetical protein
MLGRKSFTRDEVDTARRGMGEQLAAYRALTTAIAATPDDDGVAAALAAFETRFATDLLLALDRPFVHRVRMVTGKDTNPLNEVELLVDSLMTNDGVLEASTVIKHVPERSVLGLGPGDRIRPSVDEVDRLAKAFYAELEARFVDAPAS